MPRGSKNICTPVLVVPVRPTTTTQTPSFVIDLMHSNQDSTEESKVRLVFPRGTQNLWEGPLYAPYCCSSILIIQKVCSLLLSYSISISKVHPINNYWSRFVLRKMHFVLSMLLHVKDVVLAFTRTNYYSTCFIVCYFSLLWWPTFYSGSGCFINQVLLNVTNANWVLFCLCYYM